MGKLFDLVVLDIAGTTVMDENEVETCFQQAAKESNVVASQEEILSMMGWSKRLVFETLLTKQLGAGDPELTSWIDGAYACFRRVLETHYENAEIKPTPGCLEFLDKLKANDIRVCLTTGFYRKVTDIILNGLNWKASPEGPINLTICSDEVQKGRPAPFLIQTAMLTLGIEDVRRVIKVGDTPSDLKAGRNAGCGLVYGILCGTHTEDQLGQYDHDGLIEDLGAIPGWIFG